MMTREQWLGAGVELLRPIFMTADALLPPVIHTSIGFPSRGAVARTRVLGQCWSREASQDGNCQIYISPVLITPVDVLDTLTHELVHVVTPGAGHKGQFISVSKRIGLTEGKPKSAAAGADLRASLERIASDLGELPHPPLSTGFGLMKKQGTRMVKCECPECGYTARTTRKWLDVGAPICPTCRVETEYDAETIAV